MTTIPYEKLFAGHDAGAYTLPAELLHARDTFRKVEALPYPKPPRNAWETVQDFAAAVVESAHHDTPLPDPATIEAARTAERVYQDALDAMALSLEIAARRVRAAVHTDDIVTGHLAPAHDETWQAFKDAHAILREYGETEHRRLLNAPPKVRKAADAVDRAAERYTAVRAGYDALNIRCTDDPRNEYSAIRNRFEMHPTIMRRVRPGWSGLDPRQFLAWMADRGGQLWCPTAEQQAEAVRAEQQHRDSILDAGKYQPRTA